MNSNNKPKDFVPHPILGDNSRLAYCANCGEDTGRKVLLGAASKIYRCGACSTRYVHRKPVRCKSCGAHWKDAVHEGEVGITTKLPDPQFCDLCKRRLKAAEEVTKGGVFWTCVDCKADGVILSSDPICKKVREALGVPAPKPCAVEVSAGGQLPCPACTDQNDGGSDEKGR